MPEYLAPGVFVEEIDSGSKPIEGVAVNTAAFIGYAKSGEFNKPTFITNWTQFCETFGEEENALTAALVKELGMSVSDVRAAKKASRKSWMAFSLSIIDKAVREKKSSVKGFQDFLRQNNIPQGGLPYMEGSYLAHAVNGYYQNGGGRCYVIRIAHPDDIKALSFTAEGKKSDVKASPTPAKVAAGPLLLTAQKTGTAGNDIKVEVEHVGDGNEFRLKISQGDVTETFPGGAKDKPLTLDTAAEPVNKFSKLVKLELAPKETITVARPDAKTFLLSEGLETGNLTVAGGTTAMATSSPLSNGLANLRADDFAGDEAQRTGLNGLVAVEGVQFIAIPDLMAGAFQREEVPGGVGVGPEVLVLDDAKRQSILDIQCALVAHCERMGNRMAILDPLPGLSPQEVNEVTLNTAYNSDNGQAALYYPWIKIADPMNKGQQKFVPPSGHVAGVWARVGSERGVHKAPANEFVMGAVDLEITVTKGEQELLNPNGINCIRSFPGMGIKIWGARTLATVGNPSWKYVNVRRLFNYLKDSLDRGLQWVVFEPNDSDLWGRVRRTISAFLWVQWKEGMLFGKTPAEAYYVKCDEETNPQEMIDLGRLYVEIGINPVKPAEFVIIRMGQWSSGSSASEQ
jgi:phage tail sheath protein FI